MLIKVELSSSKDYDRKYVYFKTDNTVNNTYCQPSLPIKFKTDNNENLLMNKKCRMFESENATCVSGNIRMLSYEDARKENLNPSGSYTEWIDINKNPVENMNAFFKWRDEYLKKLV